MEVKQGKLPNGVILQPLQMHHDERGCFTELFRQECFNKKFIQWNMVRSHPGTLRGVHVHHRHSDYFIVIEGKMSIGLHDLRENSATYQQSSLLELTAEKLTALFIPCGVAHGFYSHTRSIHVYSVTHYWDIEDELGCMWNDPGLNITWPEIPKLLSDRDKNACSLEELKKSLKLHDEFVFS